MYYKIVRIEGEYAYLAELDTATGRTAAGEELFIAMALLPEDADIGMTVKSYGGEIVRA